MRSSLAALSGAVLCAAALTACSKPADKAVDATSATAIAAGDSAMAAGDGAMASGGAVSPAPANGNEAVNADGNTMDASQSAGANSFTEGQARGHIENAGYTEVSGLTKNADGLWTGQAKKAGKTMNVSVDFKGAVAAQ